MAALDRPDKASYEIHELVKVDTTDFEDHTFCGIMFPIAIKEDLPVSQLVLRSVAVRGHLGPLTVWISNADEENNRQNLVEDYHYWPKSRWTCVYRRQHGPSRRKYQTLLLDTAVILQPGQERVLYIHSTAPHDRAIVYDNSYFPTIDRARYEDAFVRIRTGKAHLSPQAFGQTPIWGWGSAWRNHREFVGQLEYGIVYQLWHPDRHLKFGTNFQAATHTLLACQRRNESPVCRLPDECIYYILNMCRWDWFDDAAEEMSARRRIFNIFAGHNESRSSSPRTRPHHGVAVNHRRWRQQDPESEHRRPQPFRFGFQTVRSLLGVPSPTTQEAS